MSTPKGFGSQKKMAVQEGQHVTVEPVASGQYGLTVRAHSTFRLVGSDATEDDSTASIIEATSHAARVGDIIRIASGSDADFETSVWKVEANLIYLTDDLPSGAPGAGINFQILRASAQVIAAGGTSTLIQYELDGVATVVEEDTATAANSRPLPAKLLDGDGAEILGQQDSAAATTDTGTFSIIALIKRGLERWTTLLARIPVLGQTTMSGSIPVAIASNQSGVAVTGPLTDAQLRASAVPVSAASLPLPSGASTLAEQQTQTTNLAAIKTATELIDDAIGTDGAAASGKMMVVGGTGGGNAHEWTVDSNGIGSVHDSANGTLIGAVNETAPGTDTASSGLNGRLQRIAQRLTSLIALFPTSLGQKTMANSLAVTLASDQSTINVKTTGKSFADSARNNYASANVSTSAWTELIASTASAATEVEIFDSSGETLELGIGAASLETRTAIIFPGGNGRIPVAVPAGSRLSVKAISANATVGEICLNLYN